MVILVARYDIEDPAKLLGCNHPEIQVPDRHDGLFVRMPMGH